MGYYTIVSDWHRADDNNSTSFVLYKLVEMHTLRQVVHVLGPPKKTFRFPF